MTQVTPYLGIDFGTSRSTMAWFNAKTGHAEILRNAEGQDETLSIVYWGEKEIIVGDTVQELLVDPDQRKHVIVSVKKNLKTNLRYPVPRNPTPVQVATEIFRKLKRDAESGHFHQEVARAVVTCPASYDQLERDRIKQAAESAGFKEVHLLEEPAAAALAYSEAGFNVGRQVLVYDLGGGTFDLALLVQDEDDRSYRVAMTPSGLRCGGDDFDRALYDYCDQVAQEQLDRPLGADDQINLQFLFECRARKENLSTRDRCVFSSWLTSPDRGPQSFRHEITRQKFEELIAVHIEPTVRLTRTMIEQASSQDHAIESVVLVGGSSRIPLVIRSLIESLPAEPQKWEKQDVAVALGAAYYGHWLFDADSRATEIAFRESEKQKSPDSPENASVVGDTAGNGHAAPSKTSPESQSPSAPENVRDLQSPPEPEPHFVAGQNLYKAGHVDAALAELLEASRIAPGNERVHGFIGLCLMRKGQHDEAIRRFEQGIKINPADFHLLTFLGEALSAKGDYAGALAPFGEAVRLSPQSFPALSGLANALAARGDNARAIFYFESALRVNPRSVAVLCGLGRVRYQQGDYDGAIGHLQQAVALDPQNGQAGQFLNLAIRARSQPSGSRPVQNGGVAKPPIVAGRPPVVSNIPPPVSNVPPKPGTGPRQTGAVPPKVTGAPPVIPGTPKAAQSPPIPPGPAIQAGMAGLIILFPRTPRPQDEALTIFVNRQQVSAGSFRNGVEVRIQVPFGFYEIEIRSPSKARRYSLQITMPGLYEAQINFNSQVNDFSDTMYVRKAG